MTRPYASRTIDVRFSSRKGAWVTRSMAQESPSQRWRFWRATRFLLGMLASGLVAGAGTLFAFSDAGWAQPPSSWHPTAARDVAALRDAVPAGLEAGMVLYPCRGALTGGVLIGRYRSDFGGCHIGYAGKEVEVAPFEVLGATWADGAEGLGHDALVAGSAIDVDAATPFAVAPVLSCRAVFQGGTHPGSLRPKDHGCSFGFGGRAIVSENYSVLQAASWMSWTSAVAGALPPSALVGGEEGGEPFFLCRAAAPHGLYSGKIKKASVGCSIPVEGHELVEKRFEILIPRWQVGNGGSVPTGSLVSGRDETSPLFLCRTQSRTTIQLGKINEKLAGCHVGMQDSEMVTQDYEVLVQ